MWVSFDRNDRKSLLQNPTYMNNGEDIANCIFQFRWPSHHCLTTATSHVFDMKNNHTATSILTNQCSKTDSIGAEKLPLIWLLLFCRFSHVQSLVERPWLHMLARSDPTIDGQMIYVEERLQELMTAQIPIEHEGRRYVARPRMFSGKIARIGQTIFFD